MTDGSDTMPTDSLPAPGDMDVEGDATPVYESGSRQPESAPDAVGRAEAVVRVGSGVTRRVLFWLDSFHTEQTGRDGRDRLLVTAEGIAERVEDGTEIDPDDVGERAVADASTGTTCPACGKIITFGEHRRRECGRCQTALLLRLGVREKATRWQLRCGACGYDTVAFDADAIGDLACPDCPDERLTIQAINPDHD